MNGADLLVLEGKRKVIDLLILLGDLTPTDVEELLPSQQDGLRQLEMAQMVVRDRNQNISLTMRGYAALREEQSRANRVAEVIGKLDTKPKYEFEGVVEGAPVNGRQLVMLNRGGANETSFFSVARLEKIGCSAPGSRVVYRFFETEDGALSVLDPAPQGPSDKANPSETGRLSC